MCQSQGYVMIWYSGWLVVIVVIMSFDPDEMYFIFYEVLTIRALFLYMYPITIAKVTLFPLGSCQAQPRNATWTIPSCLWRTSQCTAWSPQPAWSTTSCGLCRERPTDLQYKIPVYINTTVQKFFINPTFSNVIVNCSIQLLRMPLVCFGLWIEIKFLAEVSANNWGLTETEFS